MSFFNKIVACILCSFLLGTIYYFYIESTVGNTPIKLLVEVEVDTDSSMQELFLDLYIKEGEDYIKCTNFTSQKGKSSLNYVFDLGKEKFDSSLIRLDFENFKHSDGIKINQFELKGAPIGTNINLKRKEVRKNLYTFSDSVRADEYNIFFFNTEVFDPYIVFNIKSMLFFNVTLEILMLLPWLVFFREDLYKWVFDKVKKKDFETILIAIFVTVLTLKIAWVTFVSLLLLLLSLIKFIINREQRLVLSRQIIGFLLFFSVCVLFGQVKELGQINLEFAFVLIPLIFIFRKSTFDFNQFYNTYRIIFLVLMSLILINGVIFIVLLKTNYNIKPLLYFKPDHIKLLNEKLMWWLPYSHPTFLPSFCLVGIAFSESLYSKGLLRKNEFILYCLLCLITILFLGSRIAFLAWFIIVGAILFVKNTKKHRSIYYLTILISFFCLTMVFIQKMDINRSNLWNISYSAIEENIYGYGVGSSKAVLANEVFLQKNNLNTALRQNHSHNQFITILLELGLFGLVFFVSALVYLGLLIYRNSEKSFLFIYFLFSLLLIIESPFQTATPMYFYVFLLCLSSCVNKNNEISGLKV